MPVCVRLPKFNSMTMLSCAAISMIGCGSCWPLSWIPLNTLVSDDDDDDDEADCMVMQRAEFHFKLASWFTSY